MATGDLITQDWQMERNGLLVGDGTDYDIRLIQGLLDLPEVRVQDRPLLLRHGSVPGEDYLGSRIFTVEFDLQDETSSSLSTKMSTLTEAFQASVDEEVIAFQIPGVAGGVKAQVSGRVRRRAVPVNLQFAYGHAEAAFQIDCTDPRIYSQAENTGNVGLASTGGGMSFNATFDLSFGAVSTGGNLNVTNDGDTDAPAVLRIDGPCTSPTVENVTQGKTLEFDITLSASEYLEIDTENRTVLLNGTASRYSTLVSTSRWWDLAPGVNALDFRAATATAATLTVTWRDAWA